MAAPATLWLSVHPILVNVVLQEHLKGMSTYFAQEDPCAKFKEIISLSWSRDFTSQEQVEGISLHLPQMSNLDFEYESANCNLVGSCM